MNGTYVVSYPRSGSQFLSDSMRLTVGERWRRCESYTERFIPGYHTAIKTHDFNLTDEPPTGWKVVLQVRWPMDAAASWWDLRIREGAVKEDTHDAWFEWALTAFDFYNKLVAKWIDRADAIIHHGDLTVAPKLSIMEVADVAGIEIAHEDCVHPPLVAPTSYVKFRHYRPEDSDAFLGLTKNTITKLLFK